MTLLYLSFNDPTANPGVHRKEREFCQAMGRACRRAGIVFHGLNLFSSRRGAAARSSAGGFLQIRSVSSLFYHTFSGFRLVRALLRTGPLLRTAAEEVRRLNPDVVLCRYTFLYLTRVFDPKTILPNILSVTIHQSKEPEELRLNRLGFVFVPYERWVASRTFRRVDGLIGVTREILDFELQRAGRKIPAFVFSNRKDVASVPAKKRFDFDGCELRMIFLSGVYERWHGLDRLLYAMAAYTGVVRLHLNVVGPVSRDIHTLVDRLGLGDRVSYNRYRHGRVLDRMIDEAHLAIGGLALHRKGLRDGCTLKVREYAARGIPFVLAHRDEDLDGRSRFFLRVAAGERPLNINDLITFADRIYRRYGDRIGDLLRRDAEHTIDYGPGIGELIAFIRRVARDSLTGRNPPARGE